MIVERNKPNKIPNGEPIDSVGWVDAKQHAEFDHYWEQITFNNNYELLGWAEYTPPTFKAS